MWRQQQQRRRWGDRRNERTRKRGCDWPPLAPEKPVVVASARARASAREVRVQSPMQSLEARRYHSKPESRSPSLALLPLPAANPTRAWGTAAKAARKLPRRRSLVGPLARKRLRIPRGHKQHGVHHHHAPDHHEHVRVLAGCKGRCEDRPDPLRPMPTCGLAAPLTAPTTTRAARSPGARRARARAPHAACSPNSPEMLTDPRTCVRQAAAEVGRWQREVREARQHQQPELSSDNEKSQ